MTPDPFSDPGMRETRRDLGNGLIRSTSYRDDANGKDNLIADITTETALGLADRPGLSFTYTYDANKNVTGETTGGVMASYSYTAGQDAEDRLIDWDSNTGEERDWDLSLVGDWDEFTRDEDGSGGPLLPIVQPRNHTDAHEVDDIDGTPAAHDAKGNMTNDGAVAGNARTFAWDFDNRLTTVTMPDGRVHTYTYDALGRRVSKRVDLGTSQGGGPFVETVYVCATHESGLGQVVAEYLKGQAETNPERHFVYGRYVDEPLILAREATRRLTGSSELTTRTRFLSSLVYYHRNRKYDVVGLTDASGGVLERYTYTPYGEVTILDPTALVIRTESAVDNPYAYTGRRWEPETGLYYFRARYYGPKLGRFLDRDPLGYVDGMSVYAGYFAWGFGVDPAGLAFVDVYIAAFIPSGLGDQKILNRGDLARARGLQPGELAGRGWIEHPMNRSPDMPAKYKIATDNRDRPGVTGSSKLISLTKVPVDTSDAGSLAAKYGQRPDIFHTKSGTSYQIAVSHQEAWENVGNGDFRINPTAFERYKNDSLRQATAAPTESEAAWDFHNCLSAFGVQAGGKYPIQIIPVERFVTPAINYRMNVLLLRDPKTGRGSVRLLGSHDGFPAYEVVLNGRVVHSFRPDGGPNMLKLGGFVRQAFDTGWIVL